MEEFLHKAEATAQVLLHLLKTKIIVIMMAMLLVKSPKLMSASLNTDILYH